MILFSNISIHGEEYSFSTKPLVNFFSPNWRKELAHFLATKSYSDVRYIILARLNPEGQCYFPSQSGDLSEWLCITQFAAVTLSFFILWYFLATKKVGVVLVLEAMLELYLHVWSILFLFWHSSDSSCLTLYFWGAWLGLKKRGQDAMLVGPSYAKQVTLSHWKVSISSTFVSLRDSLTHITQPLFLRLMLWCIPCWRQLSLGNIHTITSARNHPSPSAVWVSIILVLGELRVPCCSIVGTGCIHAHVRVGGRWQLWNTREELQQDTEGNPSHQRCCWPEKTLLGSKDPSRQ